MEVNATQQGVYFAYGSNMSFRRLRQRLSSVQKAGRARLVKHALRFHKYNHVDASAKCDACYTGLATDWVEGVLYQFEMSEKPQLDKVEGLGHGYEVKQITVIDELGHGVTAFTYLATDINGLLKPYDWYKYHVLVGAEENDLPADYIAQIRAVEAVPDRDEARSRREMEIYDEYT